MITKKNSATSTTTCPQSPPHSPLPSSRTHHLSSLITTKGPSRGSKSKGKRISSSKLFQKAHQTQPGQTYLKIQRVPKSASPSHFGGLKKYDKLISRCASMSLRREFQIKVGVEQSSNHEISKIMDQFNGRQLLEAELSSIRQSGMQVGSQAEDGESLLKVISSV